MSRIHRFLNEGTAQRWLTLAATVIALAMILGLVIVVVRIAGGFFWPKPLVALSLSNGEKVLGEIWDAEPDPTTPGKQRQRIKVGNRDLFGSDFRWVRATDAISTEVPADAWTFERREYGNFYGFPSRIIIAGVMIPATAGDFADRLAAEIARAADLLQEESNILAQADRLHAPSAKLQNRLAAAQRRGEDGSSLQSELDRVGKIETDQLAPLLDRLAKLRKEIERSSLFVRATDGVEKKIAVGGIVRAMPANSLSFPSKLGIYCSRWWEFLSAKPRESNTEGGILPALFGTALMVILMTVAVVPLGVVTAVYLNEYAFENWFTRAVRLALANLAGVPSIVFGAFGLAFFVYTVGGGLDRLFFSETLPTPTFGTGGILWASLTLALLTLPVVVVATEEGLQSVPQAVRDGARALGATRWQTIRKVVLPYAAPGILTGTILAVARGAGEVAPLMVTGVVKLAANLPLDSQAPFLHLDRKFMHLGFHIFDVGFQSPNVEAAKPMVYATVLVLLVLVVALNLTAIALRSRLRKKLKGSAV